MTTIIEDYICEIQEGGPCKLPATHIIREPYTPAATRILACSPHAKDMMEFGYYVDYQETHSLNQMRAERTPKEQGQ